MSDRADDIGFRFDVDGAVATVTLCRPEQRNPQSPKLWSALAAVGSTLPAGVRVVTVRAEGASFSAGLDRAMFTQHGIPGDLSMMDLAGLEDEALLATIAGFQEAFSWCRRADVLTVAAVQGHAVGAGFQLALACDLRICADDARFAMRETSLGLVPDLGGLHPLVAAVGYARALEICVTGRWVGADEAHRIGLATIVVPRVELDAAVSDLVQAVLEPPHGAVTATKALLLGAATRSYDEQLGAERQAQFARLRRLGGVSSGHAP